MRKWLTAVSRWLFLQKHSVLDIWLGTEYTYVSKTWEYKNQLSLVRRQCQISSSCLADGVYFYFTAAPWSTRGNITLLLNVNTLSFIFVTENYWLRFKNWLTWNGRMQWPKAIFPVKPKKQLLLYLFSDILNTYQREHKLLEFLRGKQGRVEEEKKRHHFECLHFSTPPRHSAISI